MSNCEIHNKIEIKLYEYLRRFVGIMRQFVFLQKLGDFFLLKVLENKQSSQPVEKKTILVFCFFKHL